VYARYAVSCVLFSEPHGSLAQLDVHRYGSAAVITSRPAVRVKSEIRNCKMLVAEIKKTKG
jgi:hypothetical protein